MQEFGRLDILVNSAAGNFLCPAEDLSVNGFKTVMEIDAVGVFNMSKAAFNALKGHGTIINISATLHYGTWVRKVAYASPFLFFSLGRADQEVSNTHHFISIFFSFSSSSSSSFF